MRRILIELTRRKRAVKVGGGLRRVELSGIDPAIEGPGVDLLVLDEALERLSDKDPRIAVLVKLRFFAGLAYR